MERLQSLTARSLVAVCAIAVLFLSFHSIGWKGPFLFLAGSFGGWVLMRLSNGSQQEEEASTERETGKPAETTPSARLDDSRGVYIPGRNFEEMLERLGSNESMLNVVLNSMGEGVLLLNQADRIVAMNPTAEKILETTEKENIGRHYLEVVRHPALADLLARSKNEGLASGEMEFSSGKDEKTFAASVAAIRVERDHLLGQIVVLSDITSIKKLMRMRTEFAANVSHELKTPLTAILGYVETLIEGAVDDKKHRVQFLQKISDQAQRLNALISDVLELSRIESGMYV